MSSEGSNTTPSSSPASTTTASETKQQPKRLKSVTCLNCPFENDVKRVPEKPNVGRPNLIRVKLEVGKTYAYCTCGFAKEQPFCDKTCETDPNIQGYEPLLFQVNVEQSMWSLCGCKRTKNAPTCDGSHIDIDW